MTGREGLTGEESFALLNSTYNGGANASKEDSDLCLVQTSPSPPQRTVATVGLDRCRIRKSTACQREEDEQRTHTAVDRDQVSTEGRREEHESL